jgi:hypothetical protein
MAFSVSEFSAQINKRGVAQSNLFYVNITLPQGLGFLAEEIGTNELSFFCRSASLPEVAVQTTPFKPKGFGPATQRPTNFEYPLLPTVFMMDSDFAVMKFFHRWMQEVVNYDVEAGYFSASPSSLLPYEFGYKTDYVCTMEITAFSGPAENKFYTYKFGNAFPVSIGSVEVAWENSAEVMTLPVQFAYDELKVDGTARGTVTDQRNIGNSALGFLSSLNSYGQAISGIRFPNSIQDAVNQYTNINTILGSLR